MNPLEEQRTWQKAQDERDRSWRESVRSGDLPLRIVRLILCAIIGVGIGLLILHVTR